MIKTGLGSHYLDGHSHSHILAKHKVGFKNRTEQNRTQRLF